MQLYVDYTNHAGKREWREIQTVEAPELYEYPPRHLTEYTGERKQLPCIRVWMPDRQAFRILAMPNIHGFHWGDKKPCQ